MNIPPWALGVMLAFALAQFGLVAAWMVRADRRLALIEAAIYRLTATMDRHSLDVIVRDVAQLKAESVEHQAAHGRNRERIDNLRDEMHTLYVRSKEHSS